VLRIGLISLSLRSGSLSRRLLALWRRNVRESCVELVEVDLRTIPSDWIGDEDVPLESGDFAPVAADLRSCDGYVLAYPVHCYTSASQAHWFIEAFGELLGGKPVTLLTAAGTSRSHLAMDDVIRALLFDVRAYVFPGNVQAVEADETADGGFSEELMERVGGAPRAFVDYCIALRSLSTPGARATAIPDQFVELFVPQTAPYVELFVDCLGYEVVHNLDGWVDLRRPGARLLLNAENPAQLKADHPFAEHRTATSRGYGVELAIVVDDLEPAHERAARLGWPIGPMQKRPWGVRDFRLTTSDGYYIRVTERPGP